MNLNLETALDCVGLEPCTHGLALRVRSDTQSLRATKSTTRSTRWRCEQHDRARYGLMIFVRHLHDRFARGALFDVVHRTVAFEYFDGDFSGCLVLRRKLRRGTDRNQKPRQTNGETRAQHYYPESKSDQARYKEA